MSSQVITPSYNCGVNSIAVNKIHTNSMHETHWVGTIPSAGWFCFLNQCHVYHNLKYILDPHHQTELHTQELWNGNVILTEQSSVMAPSPFALFINAQHWFPCQLLLAIAWHWLVSSVCECYVATCDLRASPLPCATVECSTSTSGWKKYICFV